MKSYYVYRKNGVLEFSAQNRKELIEKTIGIVKSYKHPENIANLICHYSIERNCNHHPVRILRELGYTVESVE